MDQPYAIRKAALDDCDSIHAIIEHYAEEKLILSRSHREIASTIGTFYIAEKDGLTVGTVSSYDYGNRLFEVRSLGVKREYLRRGIGTALLKRLIDEIEKSGPARIFVLSYTPMFFTRNGFAAVEKDELPEKIWKDCNKCVNRDNCTEVALVYGLNRP